MFVAHRTAPGRLVLAVLFAALAACTAGPSEVAAPGNVPTSAAVPADRTDTTKPSNSPRFMVADGKIVDVETLATAPMPAEDAAFALSGDTLFYADASRLHAFDLIGKKDRWSQPLPDALSVVATEVVAEGDVVEVLGQRSVGGFERGAGRATFLTTLPDAPGSSAVHGALPTPAGLLVQLGDAATFLVDRRGAVTSLQAPDPDPNLGGSGVRAMTAHATREGACVQFWQAPTRAFALRCFDSEGRVRWERGWEIPGRPGGLIEESQAPWMGASSPARLLLTTQGNASYRSHQARVYATRDGTLELEHTGALGSLLEAEDGSMVGAIDASHERATLVDGHGKEVWSIPNRWDGLVTSTLVGEDLVFAAHPMVSDRGFFEIVRAARATGEERWRTKIDLPKNVAQMMGALTFVVAGGHLGIAVRTSSTNPTRSFGVVLGLDDGKVLASVGE